MVEFWLRSVSSTSMVGPACGLRWTLPVISWREVLGGRNHAKLTGGVEMLEVLHTLPEWVDLLSTGREG